MRPTVGAVARTSCIANNPQPKRWFGLDGFWRRCGPVKAGVQVQAEPVVRVCCDSRTTGVNARRSAPPMLSWNWPPARRRVTTRRVLGRPAERKWSEIGPGGLRRRAGMATTSALVVTLVAGTGFEL